MNKEEICFLPAWQIKEKVKSQELSSIEITEIFIERIEKINPIINAYCTTSFDLARKLAKEADERIKKGGNIGLLNGIPTSIKDLNQVKGVRTTFGSKIYEDNIPEEDGVAIARLKIDQIVYTYWVPLTLIGLVGLICLMWDGYIMELTGISTVAQMLGFV